MELLGTSILEEGGGWKEGNTVRLFGTNNL
jgi:hypothetical protein